MKYKPLSDTIVHKNWYVDKQSEAKTNINRIKSK